jgi:hypothetical protein
MLTICSGICDRVIDICEFDGFIGGRAIELRLEALGLFAEGREGAVEVGSLTGERGELGGYLRGGEGCKEGGQVNT